METKRNVAKKSHHSSQGKNKIDTVNKTDKRPESKRKNDKSISNEPNKGMALDKSRSLNKSRASKRTETEDTVKKNKVYLLDLKIGIDIIMNLRTHKRASVRACAYAHGDYTNRPPIRDVQDMAY